ncbi:MAG: hypothetical protein ACXQS3_07205 [Candidatus Methanofastidiosia archaeon]
MRSLFKFPFLIVMLLLAGVVIFSFVYAPQQSSIIVLQTPHIEMSIAMEEIEKQCDAQDIHIYDVWQHQNHIYRCVYIYDFIETFLKLSEDESKDELSVIFTNIQGRTVNIPYTDMVEYKDVLLLVIGYQDSELAISFSNKPSAGGPMKLVIYDPSGTLEDKYGPESWLWCIYKVTILYPTVAP